MILTKQGAILALESFVLSLESAILNQEGINLALLCVVLSLHGVVGNAQVERGIIFRGHSGSSCLWLLDLLFQASDTTKEEIILSILLRTYLET